MCLSHIFDQSIGVNDDFFPSTNQTNFARIINTLIALVSHTHDLPIHTNTLIVTIIRLKLQIYIAVQFCF